MRDIIKGFAVGVGLAAAGLKIYKDNFDIDITEMTYQNEKLPSSFNDYKILHISDFHDKRIGENNDELVGTINSLDFDAIFITGDLLDKNRTDMKYSLNFIDRIKGRFPIYYVCGNHEITSFTFEKLSEELENRGIVVLNNEKALLSNKTDTIDIYGARDLEDLIIADTHKYDEEAFEERIKELLKNKDDFGILLIHRPEYFDFYEKYGADLVFAGHAHGGQFRFPFIKGLYAPNQGVFPKYTAGAYVKNDTTMIVSRGIGNSKFKIRIGNNPNLVLVTLRV